MAFPWQEVVGGLLGLAAQIAQAGGGKDGADFAKELRRMLEDSGIPLLREAARKIADEAAEALPRRRVR